MAGFCSATYGCLLMCVLKVRGRRARRVTSHEALSPLFLLSISHYLNILLTTQHSQRSVNSTVMTAATAKVLYTHNRPFHHIKIILVSSCNQRQRR